ncbi:outer membrane protein [Collimonas sp. OK307]|uniref:OmpW/AlkL family protein n=1 Tax=Collimonas sp. OK307 TaxID=1801620 RepID=UPI0008EF7F28|nr:OmpW family outer membrane protein [Collimonas sp. OK307]SFH61558.1 outer membrane protein [Collimonas sp. OK307]
MQAKKLITSVVAVLPIASTLCGAAYADDIDNNSVRIGYAKVRFNIQSGDLTGPPGTTPPGLKIGAKDLDILAISYERRLSSNWAAQLQVGIPPILTAVGAGVATPVGTVAKARIWFPTAMVRYTFVDFPVIRPYVGMGMTYTFFTDQRSSPAYTNAFQGSSSAINLKSALGPYARVGFEYPIDQQWCINMEYSTFRLKTSATVVTQTPGIGAIARQVAIKDSPHIFGLTIGYKF